MAQPQKAVGSQEMTTLEDTLVDELSGRGLVPSTALKLLRSLPPGRLEQVQDYVDYWDEQKKTKNVKEGLLRSDPDWGRFAHWIRNQAAASRTKSGHWSPPKN